jgi:predicted esterase
VTTLAYHTARRYAVPLTRVVFSGFSQGAAVSLICGLTSTVPPAAVVMMSGYFAGSSLVGPRIKNRGFDLLMCHGTQDPLLPMPIATASKQLIEKTGINVVDFKTYAMGHSATPQEIDDVARFIAKKLP